MIFMATFSMSMKKIVFLTDNLNSDSQKLVSSLEIFLNDSDLQILKSKSTDIEISDQIDTAIFFADGETELKELKEITKNLTKNHATNVICVLLSFEIKIDLAFLKSQINNQQEFENYDGIDESIFFLNRSISNKVLGFLKEKNISTEFYLNFKLLKENIFSSPNYLESKWNSFLKFASIKKIDQVTTSRKSTNLILDNSKMTIDQKICLAHLPQWSTQQPPMGIAYLASYLKKNGFECTLRDFSIEMFHELGASSKHLMESSDHELWLNASKFKKQIWPHLYIFILKWIYQILRSPIEYLGLTVLTTSRFSTLILASSVKNFRPDIKIILGGPYAARYDGGLKLIKYPSIDFIIPDEGEEVIGELIQALNSSSDYTQIAGLIYKKGIETIDTGQRPLILNIDQLPFPDFSLFPISFYKSIALPILGSRGCIFSCTFCSETVFWRRYRYRTGQNLFEEFKFHFEKTGQRYYYIVDSLINGNIKELEIFCDFMIEYKEKIEWGGKASIRRQMTPELLVKMKKAGCLHLEYGIESGSPKVLRDMKKGYTVEIGEKVVKDTCNAGIRVGTFWLVGFPTESEEDYELSKKYLFKLKPYLDHATPGYGAGLLKGSDIQLNPEKYGIIQKNGDWYTVHSTPEIRQHRVKDFRNYCEEINVKVH
jgi:anaerobic magnesium-protoporphyrin IX monomethyl ester cyclase